MGLIPEWQTVNKGSSYSSLQAYPQYKLGKSAPAHKGAASTEKKNVSGVNIRQPLCKRITVESPKNPPSSLYDNSNCTAGNIRHNEYLLY